MSNVIYKMNLDTFDYTGQTVINSVASVTVNRERVVRWESG